MLNKGHGKPVDWWTLGPKVKSGEVRGQGNAFNHYSKTEFGVMRQGERPRDGNGGREEAQFEKDKLLERCLRRCRGSR